MANEGFTDPDELIKELHKRTVQIKQECRYPEDYSVKIAALGTGGFLPEMIYHIGQAFSSDAFYFLDENTNMELNLIKPVLLRQAAMVSAVQVSVTAINGVLIDKQHMTNEYAPYDYEGNNIYDETKATYFIHDIATDMTRHIVLYLSLPNKHKKALKNKDVLTVEIKFRDSKMQTRSIEQSIAYSDIPLKEKNTAQHDLTNAAEHEVRIMSQKCLNKAAVYMKKLDRSRAKACIHLAKDHINTLVEYMATVLPEEIQENFAHHVEPVLANLDYCENIIGDLSVRWDDVWGRLKAMSSCLGREVPTADGVFVEGTEPFQPRQVDDRIDDLAALLREIYEANGLSTETIDNYRTVMKELQDKLEKLESEDVFDGIDGIDGHAGANFKETRI